MKKQKSKTYIPFTREMKKNYTILAPTMLPMHFSMVVSVMKSHGYNAVLLDGSSPEIIENGLRYVHNDACYPAIMTVGQLVEGDAEQAGHRTDQQQKQLKPVHMLQKTIQRPHGGLPSLSMGHPWTNKYLFIIPDSQRKYKTANQAALFQKMLRRENFGNLQKAGG